MIGTITLNPSIDQHIKVHDLVKDDANRALSVVHYPGGKGINVSKVVKELGAPTKAYGIVGGITGEHLRRLSADFKIDLDAMTIKGESRINTILTDIKDHTQTRVSAPGPQMTPADLDKFLRHLLSIKPKPFMWTFGGSLSAGSPAATYQKFILALQRAGTPCVLDTDNEALKKGIAAKPFMIKPNEHEIARLLGAKFSTMKQYKDAARHLVSKGIEVVVVSLGEKGALFVAQQYALEVVAPKVKAVSKVGAGDSLIAGFVVALFRKKSFHEAARLAVACGTAAVMSEGTRLCRREDVRRVLSHVRIKAVS